MVYRKTEKVKATLEARRDLIVASTIDVIAKSGECETRVIAARAGISEGGLYHFFADKTELLAAVTFEITQSDLEAMRAVSHENPLYSLPAAIVAFYGRLSSAHLARFRFASRAHYVATVAHLAGLIRAIDPGLAPKACQQAASATLGAIYALHALGDGARNDARAAVLFALRAIGLSEARIVRTMDRGWGTLWRVEA